MKNNATMQWGQWTNQTCVVVSTNRQQGGIIEPKTSDMARGAMKILVHQRILKPTSSFRARAE